MKITKVEIITRASKLEELKQALNDIGVLGMTVSQVFGCGLSKGHTEVYRGKKYDINLVPKIKLETVVCEIPVERVLEVAQKAVRTGNIGDGKIFVYNVAKMARSSSTNSPTPSASAPAIAARRPSWTRSNYPNYPKFPIQFDISLYRAPQGALFFAMCDGGQRRKVGKGVGEPFSASSLR